MLTSEHALPLNGAAAGTGGMLGLGASGDGMPADCLALTRLVLERPGPRRLLHAAVHRGPLYFGRRLLAVGAEVATAQVADLAMAGRLARSQVLSHGAGGAPAATGGRRIALYVHFSRTGSISRLVCQQLAGYRALGFDVVLATNADRVDTASWQVAAAECWRLVQRRNIGLDFGAWRDAAAMVLAGRAPPEELLLVNDSVLGPVRPLAPLFECARNMGNGAVGLTESRQGGVHLQSYFLLTLGQSAVADTLEFLARLRLSSAKWLIVRRGELGLTRHLVRRGHRVAALFGYERVLDAILASAEEKRYLATLVPPFAGQIEWPDRLYRSMLRWPLNPTTHLWRGLIRCLGFPFIKTALLRQGSGLRPVVVDWTLLPAGDAAVFAALVEEHLATLGTHPGVVQG